MKDFMDENFLLDTRTAKLLFSTASKEPIFDYHCHLSPKEIYENKPFANIAELWLGGDHYKWRAMRACGIPEANITGEGRWREKFDAWAETLPNCIGNPLYHWTHLELQRYFGIETPLSPKTAEEIWNRANAAIASPGFTPREIIRRSGVIALCTTDDPADSLQYHALLRKEKGFGVKILPAFRPDSALQIGAKGFADYIGRLSESSGVTIRRFDDLKDALARRVEYFVKLGCVTSDHSFSSIPCCEAGEAEVDAIFRKALEGELPNTADQEKYMTALLRFLAAQYKLHSLAMELHVGPIRDNNTRMLNRLGPNTGFDSIGDSETALPLARMLDSMAIHDALPKTILFAMNPKDNCILASMAGNFQSEELVGKMQFGPAWWMNDHIDGMRRQMTDLASLGVLGSFIGMVTDSRSFLSYPRHEYFRRILCGLIGSWVENGEYPCEMDTLTKIVKNISFENAKTYFGI